MIHSKDKELTFEILWIGDGSSTRSATPRATEGCITKIPTKRSVQNQFVIPEMLREVARRCRPERDWWSPRRRVGLLRNNVGWDGISRKTPNRDTRIIPGMSEDSATDKIEASPVTGLVFVHEITP